MSFVPAGADRLLPSRLASAPRLDLPEAVTRQWAYGDGLARGVKVAVVDSGIEASHPAIGGVAGGVVLEADPRAPDGVRVVDELHGDLFGHGTACAGILRSLAPAIELFSVRVLGAKLTGRAHVFARGLAWCIDNGMQVVNLSMSTHNDDWYAGLHELCDMAAYAGIVVVGALNNERKSSYPSEFSSVLSVAAIAETDRERFVCNPNPPPEWGAAGIAVKVPWSGGRTVRTTGNSFAAPVIAGHAARIIGAHPHITPWQVRTVLAALAQNA